jgi:hypothetical protein
MGPTGAAINNPTTDALPNNTSSTIVPDDFVVADADSVSIHSGIGNAQDTEKSVIGLN